MLHPISRLSRLWHGLSTQGISDQLDPKAYRLAHLTQSTTLIIIAAFGTNTLYYILTHHTWAWYPNAIGLAIGLFLYALNVGNRRMLARHLTLLSLNLIMIMDAYIWGPGLALEFVLTIPTILSTLFFRERKSIAMHVALSVASFFIIHLIYAAKTEYFQLLNPMLTYFINAMTVFCILIVFVLIHRKQQYTYAADLESANRHIMDSIRYAQRIQKGLLGKPETLLGPQQQGMVFFKPRDIVSGDFYWSAQVGSTQVIVAADCTGHGVPGAFMTVMGATCLEDIVRTQHITDPAEILHRLDERVISAVSSKGNSASDGMDLALLVLDTDTQQIHFAGAKNPLLAVHNQEVTYTKGSVFPIGQIRLKKPKKFVTHSFPWVPGTRYYLYSDGYPDQFGGPDRRKFLAKRFRKMLIDNSSLPWETQHSHLEQSLKEWQGKEKQTDDILVVGLQV